MQAGPEISGNRFHHAAGVFVLAADFVGGFGEIVGFLRPVAPIAGRARRIDRLLFPIAGEQILLQFGDDQFQHARLQILVDLARGRIRGSRRSVAPRFGQRRAERPPCVFIRHLQMRRPLLHPLDDISQFVFRAENFFDQADGRLGCLAVLRLLPLENRRQLLEGERPQRILTPGNAG